MKEWKDKEVILGLILIIILGAIALFLLIRREVENKNQKEMVNVQQEVEEETESFTEEIVQDELLMIEKEEQEPQETEESTEEISEETSEVKDEILSSVLVIKPEKENPEKNSNKIYLYTILGEEKYKAASLIERKKDDGQLKELYEYWDSYKLEAVDDLVRLERLQEVSGELEGTNKYYYYGSVDALGRPNGKGLAVYEDNTYYFGEWKDGLRHGKGMWLEVAIYTDENKNKNLGVVEHSYNGQWSKDLPNGEGQEHFTYDYNVLKEEYFNHNQCIANVIGGFKDGYYHGEMYIMTTDEEGKTTDWKGNCQNGVWQPFMEGKTTDAVWESYEKDQEGNPEYHYMYPKQNTNYGIIGLKK